MFSPVAQVFAEEWPRLVATLMRDLGDLELAEDAAQDAFVEAAKRWGPATTPDRPGAWLLTTARRKAIDQLRRRQSMDERLAVLGAMLDQGDDQAEPPASVIEDSQLAMIFGCCHPSLATEAQVALTLRHVGGLSTAQIAAAFVVGEETMAKRLVRAKHKVRDANVPFVIPDPERLNDRLAAVLHVIYLIFTEGHAPTDGQREPSGVDLVRGSLCDEARWLSRMVADLLPDEPEANGLAALLCFTDARRHARIDADGEMVLLDEQDRSRWDAAANAEGHHRLARALEQQRIGPFQLQAAIAAIHALAPTAAETDWAHIANLYRRLMEVAPSAVVALNAAVAESMVHGPEHGLTLLDTLEASGRLERYRFLPAARADLLRQLGRWDDAAEQYRLALDLTTSPAEQRFLTRRLEDVTRRRSLAR
ncbi:MAG: sigma-70 family RNA polymerase sigma factor [Acidimicrobiales bacterium]